MPVVHFIHATDDMSELVYGKLWDGIGASACTTIWGEDEADLRFRHHFRGCLCVTKSILDISRGVHCSVVHLHYVCARQSALLVTNTGRGGRSFLNVREVAAFSLLAILEDETKVVAVAYDGNSYVLEYEER